MSMDSILQSEGVVDPYPLTIQSEQALREGLFLAQRSILDPNFVNWVQIKPNNKCSCRKNHRFRFIFTIICRKMYKL